MKYKEISMNNELHQFLISCILGDGSFTKISGFSKNSRISIAHGVKQYEYIKFKHSLLAKQDLAGKLSYNKIENSRYKNGFVEEYRFKSFAHPLFTDIRLKYYDHHGNKRISYGFIKDLDAFGLALWYMDDGYATASSAIISTCSFTLDERLILQKVLKNNFNINCTVDKNDNSIYILHESFELFKSIISPYMLNSLYYKLIPYRLRGPE